MSFSRFLLETTVSQLLKNIDEDYRIKVRNAILETLSREHWFNNLNQQYKEILLKWMVYETYKSGTRNFLVILGSIIRGDNSAKDYLSAMFQMSPNVIKNKLNNPNYSLNNLQDDSEEWHVKMASRKRVPGPEGYKLELSGMPHGWYWVDLEKSSCSEEGKAGGHCGNMAGSEHDNIYSLRDANGIVHLTFIVDDGILGESKGYGNSKPSKIYHPQIMALLLGKHKVQYSSKSPPVEKDIISYIAGGGYKPENNFQFSDLSKENQQKILKVKPYILDLMKGLESHYEGDKNSLEKRIERMLPIEIKRIEGNEAVVEEWESLEEMLNWLKENTYDKNLEIPDLENMQFEFYDADKKEIIDHFEDFADKDNKVKIQKLIKNHRFPNIEKLIDENDEIRNALERASSEALSVGAFDDAYNSISKYLDGEQDREKIGFYLEKFDNHKWKMVIRIEDLIKQKNISIQDIQFVYHIPYNGYYGFSEKVYNERLSDELNELNL